MPITSPSHGTRLPPESTAFFLKNGLRSLITFASNRDVKLWEKAVMPPGIDGGATIPLGSLYSQKYQMISPSDLITVTEARALVAYDPAVMEDIINLVNLTTDTITLTFPNTNRWSFNGCLQKFIPNEMTDGIQPTALITVISFGNYPQRRNNSPDSYPETGINFGTT